jgi:hypothetical protein
MGKSIRFDSGAEADGNSTVPFNPALAEALNGFKAGVVLDTQLPTSDIGSVVDVLAAVAVDQTVDTSAPSGDAAPVEVATQVRPPKAHRGNAPRHAPPVPQVSVTEVASQQPTKVELSPDAVWDYIPLRHFLEFDTATIDVIVTAIRRKGKRPVVRFEVDSLELFDFVDFGLAMLPGKPDGRVQMVVLGGEGIFASLFARSTFFRDEVFGHQEAPPMRFAKTRGLMAMLDLIDSIEESRQ